jgi:putative DNA modification/repair radical SAM protein
VNIIFNKSISPDEKVALMQADARFDVAHSDDLCLPDLFAIKNTIKSKPALPKVPKVFLSNACSFNCAYCGCRASNESKTKYQCAPRELAELAVRQSKRGGHGVFISSAIFKSADYTEELIIETLRIIRRDLGYKGYIHAKVMPGTDPKLIWMAGQYANRLSVNIEVANSMGYPLIAKNKNKENILTPMRQICEMIREARSENTCASRFTPFLATSQTTQLMAGSIGEDDRTILNLSGAMYKKYGLSRVYYTAYHYLHPAAGYEHLSPVLTPPWRMQRLYQADRLMQLYGFTAEDIAPESALNLSAEIDPKMAWALRNLHLYPVEVNRADYEALIRVPGIGLTYARRILKARKCASLTHESLKALGVSLKRSTHFITCNGKYRGDNCENPDILRDMFAVSPKQVMSARISVDSCD